MTNNISNYLFLLIAILTIGSCSKTQAPLPIEEAKLKDILVDVHMAEAAIQPIVGLKKDSLKELYFSQIFEIHQVHPVDFEATMEILQTNPARMKKIYKEMTEEVKSKKKEYSNRMKAQKDTSKSRSELQLDTLSR